VSRRRSKSGIRGDVGRTVSLFAVYDDRDEKAGWIWRGGVRGRQKMVPVDLKDCWQNAFLRHQYRKLKYWGGRKETRGW